ncbi:MAG: hypothetical protein N2558_01845 [Patescibacteria group bacterium]|nr:hypothetical protein [Patescibacteria group bacterium]
MKNLVFVVLFCVLVFFVTQFLFNSGFYNLYFSKEVFAESYKNSQFVYKNDKSIEVYQSKDEYLFEALNNQKVDSIWPLNYLKFGIREAVNAGVPVNTIVLLLLMPIVATFIAAARHLGGVRGFGIFLPAALSVVFLSTGAIVGIGLFVIIVVITTIFRMILRKLKFRLQYLPRMALLLWFVVLGVLCLLFFAPYFSVSAIANVSIFPILILVLLAEDFTKAQLGKSARYAVGITTETLLLALVSYLFLTLEPIQVFALLNPEVLMIGVFVANILLGQYVGLRLLELWRFRKLIKS